MPGKFKKILIIILVGVLAGLFYYYAVIYKKEAGLAPVQTTGVVEALETNISPKIPGKLKSVHFREGDRVKAGDLVAELEDEDLNAAVRQAEASLKGAKSSLSTGYDEVENARAGVNVADAGTKSAEAQVDRADAQLKQAGKDLKRAKELFDKGIVSRSDLDNAETARDTRAAELSAARAGLAQANSTLLASKTSLKTAQGRIRTLNDGVSQAKNFLDLQEANLSYAKVYSPVDAVVEYRSLEPGEVVSPGTSILTLIDLAHLWVRIDLEQRYITQVKKGDRAEITLENVPGKVFGGEVFDIGREGEFAVERDVTRGKQDIKTFRTRIWVKDPGGVLKPGMTVIVTIPVQ